MHIVAYYLTSSAKSIFVGDLHIIPSRNCFTLSAPSRLRALKRSIRSNENAVTGSLCVAGNNLLAANCALKAALSPFAVFLHLQTLTATLCIPLVWNTLSL